MTLEKILFRTKGYLAPNIPPRDNYSLVLLVVLPYHQGILMDVKSYLWHLQNYDLIG